MGYEKDREKVRKEEGVGARNRKTERDRRHEKKRKGGRDRQK